MHTDAIKADLRAYYDLEAAQRDGAEKTPWKLLLRDQFLKKALSEGKTTLLELGAGPGADSAFFLQNGLSVTAVDLSGEMVRRCREKGIEAYEMDFYGIARMGRTFDCVWALNSLLHVPKGDLAGVLRGIDACLNPGGLFFMGVYGGEDKETRHVTELSETPRFFSFYALDTLRAALASVFDVLSLDEFCAKDAFLFQAALMRKRVPSAAKIPQNLDNRQKRVVR